MTRKLLIVVAGGLVSGMMVGFLISQLASEAVVTWMLRISIAMVSVSMLVIIVCLVALFLRANLARPKRGFVAHLTLQAEREDDGYVAYCVELGTASCGDTLEEAMANIQEAVLVHLDALEETGTRQRVFEEKGIELVPAKLVPARLLGKAVQAPVEPKRMESSMAVPMPQYA